MARPESRVAALGEVMLELSEADDSGVLYRLGYAGDSFNTAVMLSRLGVGTAYATLLGPDDHSQAILSLAAREGLETAAMLRSDSGRPGLYLIHTDTGGERSFHYWRGDSIARQLLQDPQREAFLADYLSRFEVLYLSGVTLAVIGMPAADAFWRLIGRLRMAGVRLLFDPNWRPPLWPDLAIARHNYRRLLAHCEWTFPTYQDERALWGVDRPEAVLDLHAELGVREIVLKCPAAQAWAQLDGERVCRRSEYRGPVVDTTGAGDAFNAGYIAARLQGAEPAAALDRGHAVAARVLPVRGALSI